MFASLPSEVNLQSDAFPWFVLVLVVKGIEDEEEDEHEKPKGFLTFSRTNLLESLECRSFQSFSSNVYVNSINWICTICARFHRVAEITLAIQNDEA